jgi:uncharacterized protein DUF1302
MTKNSRRLSVSACAAIAAATLSVQPAAALEYNFGGVQVFFDTTVSAGVSARVADRNMMFVAAGNGGPVANPTFAGVGGAALPAFPLGGALAGPAVGALLAATTPAGLATPATGVLSANVAGGLRPFSLADAGSTNSYAGSISSDDSRMNFDKGDLTSAVIKMTNDIQASYENYTVFARVNSFYDAVLGDAGSYERSALRSDGYPDAVRDIDLLDFYVSADYTVGDLPLNVRLGKQVVNWGEATFILNGISSWSPFDVGAFRRPGAEVKEGLLPIWGAYASLGLPYDLSLELFYQLEFEALTLDRAGTPFAGSDIANLGSGTGGNEGGETWVTGGRSGGGFLNRNCTSSSTLLSAAWDNSYNSNNLQQFACNGGSNAFLDYGTDFPIGNTEFYRLLVNQGTADVSRLNDEEAKDHGQYGVALRWYSEDLNSTEFGFYFMNYHSRLPIAGEKFAFAAAGSANTAIRTYVAVEENATGQTRGLLNASCNNTGLGPIPALGPSDGIASAGLNPAKVAFLNSVLYNDQYGLVADAEGILGNASADFGVAGTSAAGDYARNLFLATGAGAPGTVTVADGSLLELMMLNCALAANQSAAAGSLLLQDGSEILAPTTAVGGAESLGLYLEYPEDIKLIGMSFNTTLGDWGVQGEVAFRHDQPFQLDTDQITVAALGASCLFDVLLGADVMSAVIDATQTYGRNATCGSVAQGSVADYSGVVRDEVVTFDIGTTATYTNSNPAVGALGADIGILLTEVGAMWVADVPDEGDFTVQQWGNVCTSGTDLPLGAFVGLSPRSGCRPTQFSYGYVLVGILQYNNAFGTPITLSPRIAFSHDVKGNSPAPLSNYREGTKSVSLAIDASYQSAWRGGLSYTNIFGNEKYTKDGDKDFVSLNVSYSF